ncbi:MAG: hypothetical protein ACE5GT_13360 [Rhodospirillales bacterium]
MCDVVSIIELQACMDIRRAAERTRGPVGGADVARALAAERQARREAPPGRRFRLANVRLALVQAFGRFGEA